MATVALQLTAAMNRAIPHVSCNPYFQILVISSCINSRILCTEKMLQGMGAPLATVAAFNAVLFTVRGQMEGLLRSEPGVPLTISQQFVCGAGAGFAVSFLACPTELIKCRLQAQGALAGTSTTSSVVAAVKYGGPMDVARHVLRSEGGARGLFKGLFPTFAREVPGNATMFAVYEAFKRFVAGGSDTSSLGQGSLIMAGGIAGASFCEECASSRPL